MIRTRLAATGIALLAVSASAFAENAFDPPCEVPYRHIVTRDLDVDRSCGAEGNATTDPHKAQNRAKNNLCATGKPVPLTFSAFTALQKAVDRKGIEYGSSNNLPEDRAELEGITTFNGRNIGEGTVVRYVGFISHPRYSNVGKGKGESVNCNLEAREDNDIHVDLLRSRDEDACKSITAEIIPHFRSAAWEVEQLKQVDHPVRVTGHLFFDGSHKPCVKGKKHNPKRASVWEIHPVYQIEVCKFRSLRSCSASTNGEWIPLDEWLNIPIDDEEGEEE